MHKEVQEYINLINNNDPTLTHILLGARRGLKDDDIALLMAALAANPQAARRIIGINLFHNNLSYIDIPNTLVGLEWLYVSENLLSSFVIPNTLHALQSLDISENLLSSFIIPNTLHALQSLDISKNLLSSFIIPNTLHALQSLDISGNRLTIAAKIALTRIAQHNNRLSILIDTPIPGETQQLTRAILHADFKSILQARPEEMIDYLEKTGAALLLSRLPAALAGKIAEYVEPIRIQRLQSSISSMDNLQATYRGLLGNNNEELNTLNHYNETEFPGLVKKANNYYHNAFQGKTIQTLGLLNEFLRENGFDSTDLSKKNAQGLTPLALAKARKNVDRNAGAIIPFIERRTRGLMYRYLATATKAVYKHKELIAGTAVAAVAAYAAIQEDSTRRTLEL